MSRGQEAPMGTQDPERVQAKGEVCLLLARAFLPPVDSGMRERMADLLPQDLAACAGILGVDIALDLAGYDREMARVADDESLLIAYSQLFLVPPVPAPLNAGLYLDGTVIGPSTQAMEVAYRRRGLDRSPHFKDLPDHLSVQLEFLASLFIQTAQAIKTGNLASATALHDEAEDFAADFVIPWLPSLSNRITTTACDRQVAAPYAPLIRILRATLAAPLSIEGQDSFGPCPMATAAGRAHGGPVR
jgi:TorA maturation chaperone TorD